VDTFGRPHTYLRISVTERCNLRCVYCMPATGITLRPKEEILTFDEIERMAGICAGLGVTKIRLTGGEPLVRGGLPGLVGRLVRIKGIRSVGLTTNGVLLGSHTRDLKKAGLGSVNVSLDTLRARNASSGSRSVRLLFPFVVTSVPAAYAGGRIVVGDDVFQLLLGVALVAVAARLLFLRQLPLPSGAPGPERRWLLAGCIGLVLGLLSGLVGIGGGVFLSPVILLSGWADMKRTAAVSSAFIVVNSAGERTAIERRLSPGNTGNSAGHCWQQGDPSVVCVAPGRVSSFPRAVAPPRT
jgi:hypothetical protein